MVDEEWIDKKWGEISTQISAYYDKLKINVKPHKKIEEILNLDYVQVQQLSGEECGEYAVMVSQYAIFIQKEFNYHHAQLDWCESVMSYMSARCCPLNNYINKETILYSLNQHSTNNHAMQQIIKMYNTVKVMYNSLSELSSRLDKFSYQLNSLQLSKRKSNVS